MQDRNNSFSTISNTSNEDSYQKKGNQNDIIVGEIIRNDEELNLNKEKKNYNQLNKENISGNIQN